MRAKKKRRRDVVKEERNEIKKEWIEEGVTGRKRIKKVDR